MPRASKKESHSIVDLEARQDQVLRELDELDRRVAQALQECLESHAGSRPHGVPSASRES